MKRNKWLYERKRRSGDLDGNMLNCMTPGISNASNYSKFKYHDSLAKS